mmetsp:Transcript_43598/g.44109  ORF Transcript_43598/g.44109 Transcript_43598/m.44109 type:complete len:121 (-) Transcript_43598:385-747(-)
MTQMPNRFAKCLTHSSTLILDLRSSADVISSNIRTLGLEDNDNATMTRCDSPPDNLDHSLSIHSASRPKLRIKPVASTINLSKAGDILCSMQLFDQDLNFVIRSIKSRGVPGILKFCCEM